MHPSLRPKLILLPVIALVAAAGLSACGSSGGSKPSSADVAVVGKTHVSLADFQELVNNAKISFKAQGRTFPSAGSTAYETLKSQAVLLLVTAAEQEQQAAAMGITITDKQIQTRLDAIIKQYFAGSQKKYQTELKKQGLTDHLVRFDIKRQLVGEAVQTKLSKALNVSAADVHAYYTQHVATYTQPQSRDVRHILVKKKALADKLYAELKGGADKVWCADAKKYSQDPSSKDKCGRLTVTKGETVPAFDKVAFSQPTKKVHAPVYDAVQYKSYFIIEPLTNIKPRSTTPESTVSAAIKAQLLQAKQSDAMKSWADRVTKTYCGGSTKVKYQTGYTPSPDPCKPAATTSTTQ
jgi:parvulin-like peptidyl-prolyl isomerase